MIVITGKLDELFVRWSTQTLPPPPPSLADFDRCSHHSGLKQETKTRLKVLLKVTSSQKVLFPLVSSLKQFVKSISLTLFTVAKFRSFGTSFCESK